MVSGASGMMQRLAGLLPLCRKLSAKPHLLAGPALGTGATFSGGDNIAISAGVGVSVAHRKLLQGAPCVSRKLPWWPPAAAFSQPNLCSPCWLLVVPVLNQCLT